MTDTIFARASGAPPAGIAIIRISGPAAKATLEALAGPAPKPRMLSFRTIRDPADGALLDRGLIVWFPGPGNATGEDLAELHLHGSRAVVEAVERVLAGLPGLRIARAGEFTWRAFQNGVLDLIGVESLSDLLRAETEGQRRAAIAGAGLSTLVEAWQRDLLLVSALVEAGLDQSDEDDVRPDEARVAALLDGLIAAMRGLLSRPGAERLFDGVRVVFAGPPNSGKSSLINAIAGREVAITSTIAGTTRDVIEVPVRLNGLAFVLTDTAGLRDTPGDEIERIGIDRARHRLAAADIVVWMGDDAPPQTMTASVLPVHARADLRRPASADRLAVSAVSGEGIPRLIEELTIRARSLLPLEDEVALGRRQRAHLADCLDALVLAAAAQDELIRAEQLRLARLALDGLTGRAGTEDMLDALFSTFCVGK